MSDVLTLEDIVRARNALYEEEVHSWSRSSIRDVAATMRARTINVPRPAIFDAVLMLWRSPRPDEYEPSDSGARTLTAQWRESVRERLATGLDDAPVLP